MLTSRRCQACSAPDFAHEVFALDPGAWRGPVKSGYGFHLVFVTQRTPTTPKPFETRKGCGSCRVAQRQAGRDQPRLPGRIAQEVWGGGGRRRQSRAGVRARQRRWPENDRQAGPGPCLVGSGRLTRPADLAGRPRGSHGMLVHASCSAHEVRPAFLKHPGRGAERVQRAVQDPYAGQCATGAVGIVFRQDRDGDADRLASDRRRHGADLADAHLEPLTGRPC